MRVLNLEEMEMVSGGTCENMTVVECYTGTVDLVIGELKDLGGYIGEAWDAWCDYNDLGIWLYNYTNNC